jgi:glycosyltransferase involved in cell wall biosynthesis
MKILIFNWQDIKNPLGGGAEVHLHEIFKRIVKLGHKVTLYSCQIPNEPDYEVIDGIDVHRIGSRQLFNYYVPKIYRNIYRNIKKSDFDIVIDDINKIPFYTPLFVKDKPLLAISHHFFGKSIFKEAGIISGTYVYLSEYIVNYIYKHTPFAVVSNSTKDEFISRGFNPKNFSLIYNAYDHELFDFPHNTTNPELFRIAYFGRLKKYKSVDQLFYAFAKFTEKNPNSKLEIIGRGDFRPYLEELSQKLNIADKTHFYGFVSEEEKVRILREVDLVVNTSQKEGWGITNIEANAVGTPVISANVPGLRDSVSVGESGFLYEYGNIDDLLSKINQALINPKIKQHLGEGAVKWAKSFSWDKSAIEMIELMQSVIANYRK